MTEKNIFVFVINSFRFNFIFYDKTTTSPPPPWKRSPPLSHQPPSQNWDPVKLPPPFRNLVGGSTPPPFPQAERREVYTMNHINPKKEMKIRNENTSFFVDRFRPFHFFGWYIYFLWKSKFSNISASKHCIK